MVSKESLLVVLNLLKNVSVCPMVDKADESYAQLSKARNEILEALEALKDPKKARRVNHHLKGIL